MKTQFKKGDKVFVYPLGWGEYELEGISFSQVNFSGDILIVRNELISFTEYTLQGFSQERPIELPEVGEEIMVSEDGVTWLLRNFKEFKKGKILCTQGDFLFSKFKRLI